MTDSYDKPYVSIPKRMGPPGRCGGDGGLTVGGRGCGHGPALSDGRSGPGAVSALGILSGVHRFSRHGPDLRHGTAHRGELRGAAGTTTAHNRAVYVFEG